ncbi:MAG: PilZ domain-containing protein [Xanthobacteraceae bacterium]
MPPRNAYSDELVIVEHRHHARIIVSVPGYYILADHRNARGERRSFPCRAVNVSTQAIAFAAPVVGRIGERAFATVDHLGKLKGAVTRLLDGGFVMSIVASAEERDRLAAKIGWLEQFKNFDVFDQRGDRRFVPAKPHTQIIFVDGTMEDCFVLDLSASGAAISASVVPEIGTVVALAKIVARVVRHFEGGFAVQFVERQDPQHVEARLNLDPVFAPTRI